MPSNPKSSTKPYYLGCGCSGETPSSSVTLDIAVLQKVVTTIDTCSDAHVTYLTPRYIQSQAQFKSIFYPYGEVFGIDPAMCCDPHITPFISFLPPYATVQNCQNFNLLNTVLSNLEVDLGPRTCWCPDSLVELQKELSEIKTLCDLKCCNVLSALTWSEITAILCNMEYSQKSPITQATFVISVVFKTPTNGANPTVIKFSYVVPVTPVCDSSCNC
jgi:hypothetical protein